MKKKLVFGLVLYAILVAFVYMIAFGLHLGLGVPVTATANQLVGWVALGFVPAILISS